MDVYAHVMPSMTDICVIPDCATKNTLGTYKMGLIQRFPCYFAQVLIYLKLSLDWRCGKRMVLGLTARYLCVRCLVLCSLFWGVPLCVPSSRVGFSLGFNLFNIMWVKISREERLSGKYWKGMRMPG